MINFPPTGLSGRLSVPAFAVGILLGGTAHARTAAPGCSLASFATGTSIGAGNPDSISVSGGNVSGGYANDSDSAGGPGFSTVAESVAALSLGILGILGLGVRAFKARRRPDPAA